MQTHSQGPAGPRNENIFMHRMARFYQAVLDESTMEQDGVPTAFEAPDTTILVLDRSDQSLQGLASLLQLHADLGLPKIIPQAVRTWMSSPHEGHFLIMAINPKGWLTDHRFNDDFLGLLDMAMPMMNNFLAKAVGNTKVIWSPLLSEEMSRLFMRWLYRKEAF